MSRTIDGTNPGAAIPPTYTQISSGSGTYSSPSGCSYIVVELVGGGGSGGKSSGTSQPGGAGGSGAYQKIRYTPGSYSYSVGTGGVGTAGAGSAGNDGGDTSFGSRISRGGAGGGPPFGSTRGGNGGNTAGSGGIVLVDVAGQAGSFGLSTGVSSIGGSNPFGSCNNTAVSGSTPTIHTGAKGVGGGGVDQSTATSGAGTNGYILVTEFY